MTSGRRTWPTTSTSLAPPRGPARRSWGWANSSRGRTSPSAVIPCGWASPRTRSSVRRSRLFAGRRAKPGSSSWPPIFEHDPRSGRRFNTAVVIDEAGEILGRYRKTHIPVGTNEQASFCETFYYDRSDGDLGTWPRNVSSNPFFPVFETRLVRLGVAICYDRHFEGVMSALAENGAELVLSPRRHLRREVATHVGSRVPSRRGSAQPLHRRLESSWRGTTVDPGVFRSELLRGS
jgi:hypothetical protein